LIKGIIHGVAAVLIYIASGLLLTALFRAFQIGHPSVYSISVLASGAPVVIFIILSIYYMCARKDILRSLISFTVFLLANLALAYLLKPDLLKYDLMAASNLFVMYNAMFIIFLGSTTMFSVSPESMLPYILFLCSVPAAAGIAAGSIRKLYESLQARRKRAGEHG
jgi:hypothetical protein